MRRRRIFSARRLSPASRLLLTLWLLAALSLLVALRPLAALGAPAPASAPTLADPVMIRSGNHTGFGRLVFDFPSWVGWSMERHGDVVRLTFSRALPFGADPPLPRNVRALTDTPGGAEVTVVPGARLRRMRVGARLVLDVLNPERPAERGRAAVVSRREGPAPQPPVPAALAGVGMSLGSAAGGPAAQPAAPMGSGVGSGAGAVRAAGSTNAVAPQAASPASPGSARRAPAAAESGPSRTRSAAVGPAAAPTAAAAAAGARAAAAVGRPSVAAPAVAPAPVAAGPAGGAAGGSAAAGPTDDAGAPAAARAPLAPNAAVPVMPAATPGGPVALAAAPVMQTAEPRTTAVLIPFEASVGAAAFRRAGQGVVVFDTPRPIDLSALRSDPVFGTAAVHLLAAGTELTLHLPPDTRIALRHRQAGWEVAITRADAPDTPIHPRARNGEILLAVAHPGREVSLLDPETGTPLLVGTERAGGEGLAVIRRAPQFELLASWQGVVTEALSDRLTLRPTSAGFVLGEAGSKLALTPGSADTLALADAALLTRRFRFPAEPIAALARRLRTELAIAARRPPLARGPLLRRAARSMIALGIAPEAGALLHLAAAEDPREGHVADHVGLAAVAALLAGHPDRAGGLADPRLAGSDEIALWRGVRAAERHPGAPAAAQLFAATAPLILTYPRLLRRRLLPLAVETMIAGGEPAAAARLLGRRPDDPHLALARGMLDAAQGRTAAALAIYDRLAHGADRLARIRAATRAVALRLATNQIDPAQAADALDRLLDAWRGGPRELALRENLAELRAEAGEWRRAFGLLRRTAADFPAAMPALRARMRQIFMAMLTDPRLERMPPLDFVALLDANADLLPSGRAGEALEATLADRLLALDLPDQAAPVLAKLMRAAPTPAGRAGFGARLAALRLADDDAAGAAKALAESAADGLPVALEQQRAVLAAQAQAAQGHVPDALAALGAIGSAGADQAAAAIAERAGDWPGAEQALHAYVGRTLPAAGTLDPAQRQVLLRLATATVRAGDTAGVAALRVEQPRMGTGPLADMFRLLTGPAIRSVADLSRAGTEAALAGRLGRTLKAVR